MAVLAVAALTSASCGGDDGGESTADAGVAGLQCTTTACGGDPSGNWTYATMCAPSTGPNPECMEGTFAIDSLSTAGTLTLAAAGTYTTTATETSSGTLVFTPECLNRFGLTCSDLNEGGDVECAVDGADCDCSLEQELDVSETGTWTSPGTTIVLVGEFDEERTLDYCVDGDQMLLREVLPTGVAIEWLLTRG